MSFKWWGNGYDNRFEEPWNRMINPRPPRLNDRVKMIQGTGAEGRVIRVNGNRFTVLIDDYNSEIDFPINDIKIISRKIIP